MVQVASMSRIVSLSLLLFLLASIFAPQQTSAAAATHSSYVQLCNSATEKSNQFNQLAQWASNQLSDSSSTKSASEPLWARISSLSLSNLSAQPSSEVSPSPLQTQIQQWIAASSENESFVCEHPLLSGTPSERSSVLIVTAFLSDPASNRAQLNTYPLLQTRAEKLLRMKTSVQVPSQNLKRTYRLSDVTCGIADSAILDLNSLLSTRSAASSLACMLNVVATHPFSCDMEHLRKAFQFYSYTHALLDGASKLPSAVVSQLDLAWAERITLDLSLLQNDAGWTTLNPLNGFTHHHANDEELFRQFGEQFVHTLQLMYGAEAATLQCSLDWGQIQHITPSMVMKSLLHPVTADATSSVKAQRLSRSSFLMKELNGLCSHSASTAAAVAEAEQLKSPMRRLQQHRHRSLIPSDHEPIQFDATADSNTVDPLTPVDTALLAQLYTEFHALTNWLLSSLALDDKIGKDGVAKYPIPTDAEVYGFLNAFVAHAPEGHTLSLEFDDVLLLQKAEYETFGKFLLWIEIPNQLYAIRDETFGKMSPFHVYRMKQRFASTYREDLNYMNFVPTDKLSLFKGVGGNISNSSTIDDMDALVTTTLTPSNQLDPIFGSIRNGYGELQRFVFLKWKLEYVNEITSYDENTYLVESLLALHARLNATSSTELPASFRAKLNPGLMQFYYSTLIESIAHFRLQFIFESASYLFDGDFLNIWNTEINALPAEKLSSFTVADLVAKSLPSSQSQSQLLGETSIQERVQDVFSRYLTEASERESLLNRTLITLDQIQDDYTAALISGIVQRVAYEEANPTSKSATSKAATTRRSFGTFSFDGANESKEGILSHVTQWVQYRLATLVKPHECVSSGTAAPAMQAACSALDTARTWSFHDKFVRDTLAHVEDAIPEVESTTTPLHSDAAAAAARGLMMFEEDAASSEPVMISNSNSSKPEPISRSHRIMERFASTFDAVLVMQDDLLTPWLLQDAAAYMGSLSQSELHDSAHSAVLSATYRLYALAERNSKLSTPLPAASFRVWSSWMLVLRRSHPASTHVSHGRLSNYHAGAASSPWGCDRVSWDELSRVSFESMGIWIESLTPSRLSSVAHPALPYRRSHFDLFSITPTSTSKSSYAVMMDVTDQDPYGTVIEIISDRENATAADLIDAPSKPVPDLTSVFNTQELYNFVQRLQLQSILSAAGVSNVDFHSEDFIKWVIEDEGHLGIDVSLSALQILVERLIKRQYDNAVAYSLDAPKSWHSDRTKSPAASYDFTLSVSTLDLLVYLDSLCFQPQGHLYLQQIAEYKQEQLLLITRKINAGDKDLLESSYRAMIPAYIWLQATTDFEKWRWSWIPAEASSGIAALTSAKMKYPVAMQMIESPAVRIVAQSWTNFGITNNISFATLLSLVATAAFVIIELIRLILTKPWTRPSLVLNGSIANEERIHREYEERERHYVFYRIFPCKILLHLVSNFLIVTFSLTLNWSYFSPAAIIMYILIFSWLTYIILDVYLLKYFIYLASLFLMPYVDFALQPPVCPCCITSKKSTLILNPLRPASEEQLRNVVRKSVDLLWGVDNKHVISVLILQCVGNQTQTYRAYERIVRDMIYDNTEVPASVKNRFFVFQMGGISKPHNMYKVMRWFYGAEESSDPCTANYLFGIETQWKINEIPKVIKRVPEGESLPLFLQVNEGTRIQVAVDAALASSAIVAPAAESKEDEVRTPSSKQMEEKKNDAAVNSKANKTPSPAKAPRELASPFQQASSELAFLHCDQDQMRQFAERTYEPLCYLGGAANTYKGQKGQGADAGILATEEGLKILAYLRNESGGSNGHGNCSPLIENFLVLDADNYVEPTTLLRMISTMNDRYLIWQPSINFYNSSSTCYAYMKNYANQHLGSIMNISNTLTLGGVRSFGKYFARFKRFYYEEVTAASAMSSQAHYAMLYSICGYLITFTFVALLIRPIYWEITTILLIVTPLFILGTIALTLYTKSLKPDEVLQITSRYQSMFPLNRMFIQSEDARHGGPFGRAAFIMDDCIHEATPLSCIDETRREYSKWMPTFDLRDWVLLHTPLLWVLMHLKVSVIIGVVTSVVMIILTIISWMVYNDGFMHALLSALTIASVIATLMVVSLWRVATKQSIELVSQTRLPEMPERAEYAEALVSRGVFGEAIWGVQFLLGLAALLFPGTVEVAFPFLGESHLLFIIILLVHPKFSGALLTRIHRILRPRYTGFWKMMPTSVKENRSASHSREQSHSQPTGRKLFFKHAEDGTVEVKEESAVAPAKEGSRSKKSRNSWGENSVEMASLKKNGRANGKRNDSDSDTEESESPRKPSTSPLAEEEYVHTTLFVEPGNSHNLHCGKNVLEPSANFEDDVEFHPGVSEEGTSIFDRIFCCFRSRTHHHMYSSAPILTLPPSPKSQSSFLRGGSDVTNASDGSAREPVFHVKTPVIRMRSEHARTALPGHLRSATQEDLIYSPNDDAAQHGQTEDGVNVVIAPTILETDLPADEDELPPPMYPTRFADHDGTITIMRPGKDGGVVFARSHSESETRGKLKSFYGSSAAALQATPEMIPDSSMTRGIYPIAIEASNTKFRQSSTQNHSSLGNKSFAFNVSTIPANYPAAFASALQRQRSVKFSDTNSPEIKAVRPPRIPIGSNSPDVAMRTFTPGVFGRELPANDQNSNLSNGLKSPYANSQNWIVQVQHSPSNMEFYQANGVNEFYASADEWATPHPTAKGKFAVAVVPAGSPVPEEDSEDVSPESDNSGHPGLIQPATTNRDVFGTLRDMDADARQKRRPSVSAAAGGESEMDTSALPKLMSRPSTAKKSSRPGSKEQSPFLDVRTRLKPMPAIRGPLLDENGQPVSTLITLRPMNAAEGPTVLRPLTESGATVLQSQAAYHAAMIGQKAALVARRKYIIQREHRWDLFKELLLLWILHDVPVGMFEFAASTSVFLVKIVSKPFQVLWSVFGVYLEIRGLLAAIPISGTWPSFIESEETLPLIDYIEEYSVPMSVGISVLVLCLPGLTNNIMKIPTFQQYLFSATGLLIICACFALVLGIYPAYRQFQVIKYTLRKPVPPIPVTNENGTVDFVHWYQYYEWERLFHFSTMKIICGFFTSMGIAALLLVIGLFTFGLSGLIPSVFFIRAFPILVSSFIFGPAIGFLIGKVNGRIDNSTNPPTAVDSEWTVRVVVALGWVVTLLSVYFVYFFTKMLLPVQTLAGVHGPTTPTGDGSMSMMLPFTLSYNEMLKAPFYFVIPYASIVYGGVFLGVIAWCYGLGHQIWTSYQKYQEEKAFQAEMALVAKQIATEMLHEKQPEPIAVPGSVFVSPMGEILTLRDVELQRAAEESVSSSTSGADTERADVVGELQPRGFAQDLAARSSPDRRIGTPAALALTSPANRTLPTKMASPYLNIEHMRIKEAQYKQELEEAEERAFATPSLVNRIRLNPMITVERVEDEEEEQLQILPQMSTKHGEIYSPQGDSNNPASGPGRQKAWVTRGTPSHLASAASPSHHNARFFSPSGEVRRFTPTAASGGAMFLSVSPRLPSYLSSTPRNNLKYLEGSNDPRHASVNHTTGPNQPTPKNTNAVSAADGSSSSGFNFARSRIAPILVSDPSQQRVGRAYRSPDENDALAGEMQHPTETPKSVDADQQLMQSLGDQLKVALDHQSPNNDRSPSIQTPSPLDESRYPITRAQTTTAALARKKGNFNYPIEDDLSPPAHPPKPHPKSNSVTDSTSSSSSAGMNVTPRNLGAGKKVPLPLPFHPVKPGSGNRSRLQPPVAHPVPVDLLTDSSNEPISPNVARTPRGSILQSSIDPNARRSPLPAAVIPSDSNSPASSNAVTPNSSLLNQMLGSADPTAANVRFQFDSAQMDDEQSAAADAPRLIRPQTMPITPSSKKDTKQ